jgi:hypothetical protein
MGSRHREFDRPALILSDGTRVWMQNNKKHRLLDKPAEISSFHPRKFWFVEGKRHREFDKPAVMFHGQREWHFEGKRHRDFNRPAIIPTQISCGNNSTHTFQWWIDGHFVKSGKEWH